VALLTGKALFAWDRERRRFRLQSVHAPHTERDVREQTGFEYDSSSPAATPAPSAEELDLLRSSVANRIAPDYPAFVKRVWG
jgi:glutaconate CoA-transferase subunit B